MTQQNQHFHVKNDLTEMKQVCQNTKLVEKTINQLQNKAYFFQGQLNPLYLQNNRLKNDLTLLSKGVGFSTDILRGLLPIGSSQTRRLKLELANLQQISEMIKEDWLLMQKNITNKVFTIQVLENKMISNKQKYQDQYQKLSKEMQMALKKKCDFILELEQNMQKTATLLIQTKLKCQQQIQSIKDSFRLRVERADKLQCEFQIFRKDVHNRYRLYQNQIDKFKDQIAHQSSQFQQSKKNLKEIYDKIMSQKISQQAQGFQMLLRTKEQEKDRLMMYFQQKQDQLQKYLLEKGDIIGKLQQTIARQKQQIIQNDQQINDNNKKIYKYLKDIEQNENTIKDMQNRTIELEKTLTSIGQDYKIKQNKYKQQLSQLNDKLIQTKTILDQKIITLQKSNNQLQANLNEKSQKLRKTQRSLATAQRKFSQKLNQHQSKWLLQKQQIQKEKQQQRIKYNQIINEMKQSQKLQMKIYQEMEEKRKVQIQGIKNAHFTQINKLKNDFQHEIILIKHENQRILTQERRLNAQEIQQIIQIHNQKSRQAEQQFYCSINRLECQITKINTQIMQKNMQLSSLTQKVQQGMKSIQRMRTEHFQKMNQLENESLNTLKQLQKRKQDQKKKIQQQMINQLLQFQMQMDLKSSEYQQTLKKIQTQMMQQIKMLKSSNALQQLQSKYLTQMLELNKKHQSQLISIEQKQKQSQQSLIQEQRRHIQQLINQYQEDMSKLANRLQSDIQKLNDNLIIQQHDHQITKMTREQKIIYLSKKIQELRANSQSKELKILQLQLEIQYYKNQQQKIQQIISTKVNQRRKQLQRQQKQFQKQCQITIDKTRIDANKKINQIQKDRIQHTQNMFKKFNQLKIFHQEQTSKMHKKYTELQLLFFQRPSRAQDLSKIKELIDIKQKMDMEMKISHKKVQHANQIVKYLNLQLQNYKDSYDMFGPADETDQKPIIESINAQSTLKNIFKLKKILPRSNTQGSQQTSNVLKQQLIPYRPRKGSLFRRYNQSPDINQLQVFPQNLNQSISNQPPYTPKNIKNCISPILNPTSPTTKQRSYSIDKSNQIVLNAQNFLQLIKNNKDIQPIKEEKYKSRDSKAYRKIKARKINAFGIGTGEMFTMVRRTDVNKDQTKQ